jgi:hypothetical protein
MSPAQSLFSFSINDKDETHGTQNYKLPSLRQNYRKECYQGQTSEKGLNLPRMRMPKHPEAAVPSSPRQ